MTDRYFNNKQAGDLIFEDDSGQVMIIKDGGNVGIGTNSPTNNLDIFRGGTGVTSSLSVRSPSPVGINNAYLILNSGGSGTAQLRFAYQGAGFHSAVGTESSGQSVKFWTGNDLVNEKVTIAGNGNVGIGTNDPDQDLTASGSGLTLFTDTSNTFAELALVGSVDTNGGDAGKIIFREHDSGTTGTEIAAVAPTASNNNAHDIVIRTGTTATERMRVAADGDTSIQVHSDGNQESYSNVYSGTYTPTVDQTKNVNVAGTLSPTAARYIVVGKTLHISGQFQIGVSAGTNQEYSFVFDLPAGLALVSADSNNAHGTISSRSISFADSVLQGRVTGGNASITPPTAPTTTLNIQGIRVGTFGGIDTLTLNFVVIATIA